ncbi:hypothetical protein [Paenibacillus aceris]|uniref:Uncharacterized protein n=1 Tax=Paenibacillus aceris TaxID=869555 RepID=A0ABS4I245_9BACL|nr:hypothetical protein [Paenibacillus aceris]MBP1964790.1 hypothetical protein [Paenibacillus aceris]NHW33768.1 hypothetical protein [Paenibacillus aceris]
MYDYPAYYYRQQPVYPHPPTAYLNYQPYYSPYESWDRTTAMGHNPYEHRDYPAIDSKILSQSLTASQHLLKDASLVIQKLADPAISHELMKYAQQGNQKEVDRIIHSFGSKSLIVTSYSPSAVKFAIDPHTDGMPCCEVTLMLKWGQ